MLTPGNQSPKKDRKKSANWDDGQTETLVDVLLRYKDTGRTPDNGFRPEVWQEASNLLQRSTFLGGPKTPEACKSRWQRVQREYRAAKEMEQMPGFSWDLQNGRLHASPEAWKAAGESLDVSRYQKIHLTCYTSMTLLCPPEPSRSRQRSKQGRTSLASSSDTSSLLSISVGGSSAHVDESHSGVPIGVNGHHAGHLHGHGHGHGQERGHMSLHGLDGHQMQQGLAGQMDASLISWGDGDDEDGEGEFDSFTLPDGSQHSFTLPNTTKRMHFDTSMLAGPSQQPQPQQLQMPGPSPPKKPRTDNGHPSGIQQQHHQQLYSMTLPGSPSYSTSGGLLDPAILTTPTDTQAMMMAAHQAQAQAQVQAQAQAQVHAQVQAQAQAQAHQHHHHHHQQQQQQQHHQMQQQQQQQQQQQSQQHTQQIQQHPRPHQMQPHTHHHQPPNQNTPLTHSRPGTQPNTPIAPAPLKAQNQNQNQNQNHTQNRNHTSDQPIDSSMIHQKLSYLPSPGNGTSSGNGNGTGTGTPLSIGLPLSTETQAAGLTEAQRRTEAILQLQRSQVETDTDLRDEDLIEVMAEFEANVAAADTYLAIKRGSLRRMWLMKVLTRRKKA